MTTSASTPFLTAAVPFFETASDVNCHAIFASACPQAARWIPILPVAASPTPSRCRAGAVFDMMNSLWVSITENEPVPSKEFCSQGLL